MFIAKVIKRALIVRPYISLSSTVPLVASARRSSNGLQHQTTTVISKPTRISFRQFSSTCVTSFRTANSFICRANNDDDSEESGKSFLCDKSQNVPR